MLNTWLKATIEAPKCASDTALMAAMWESAAYLSPNLPLSKELKSYLLLLMTLHISIYLKHNTALLSLPALNNDIFTSWARVPHRSRNMRSCSPDLERIGCRSSNRSMRSDWANSTRCWRWHGRQSGRLWPWRSCECDGLSCSTKDIAPPAATCRQPCVLKSE